MKRHKTLWVAGFVITLASIGSSLWLVFYSPHAYLKAALDIVQESAYYSDRVDWSLVRPQALALASGAMTRRDTYPAIEFALGALGDHHSFLQPRLSAGQVKAAVKHNRIPIGLAIGNEIGYVQLPGLLLDSGLLEDGRQYAAVLQQEIARLESRHARCGWIVDLRQNFGGNFGHMLAGVGPILGEGVAMHFVTRGGKYFSWSYNAGKANFDGTVNSEVLNPYQVKQPGPATAVIIGSETASAGEAVAIAFMGRSDTRFFGQPTAGLTTGNAGFPLADGATLFLTIAIGADRLNHTYTGAIDPDVLVTLTPEETDPVVNAAVKAAAAWLGSQPSCRSSTEGEVGI